MVPSRARPVAVTVAIAAAAIGGCDSRTRDWPDGARRAAPPGPTTTVRAEPDAGLDAPDDRCPDPIAGLWVARRFDGATWYEHRVTLRRAGTTLTCTQESRSWLGTIDNALPPPCPRPGRGPTSLHHVTLRCDADERPPVLRVRSLEILSNIHTCNDDVVGYNLDSFDGEPRGNTWATTNNDGGDDVDMPYRFRRLACEP